MGIIEDFVRLLAIRSAATSAATTTTTSTKAVSSSTTLKTTTTTTTSSSHASTTTSTSAKSTTSTSTKSTTTSSSSLVYNMTVQTIFTPPPACTSQGITVMQNSTDLWNNLIAPATQVVETSCYPSQFWSSAVATTSLPPFKQLICPSGWGANQINSTYIVCCPSGFGLYAPNVTNTQRPATSAICTSVVWPSVLYDYTSWGSATVNTTVAATAGINGTLVLALPFDGIAASTTITSPTTKSGSSTTTRSSSITSHTSVSSTTSTTAKSGSKGTSSVPLSTLQPS